MTDYHSDRYPGYIPPESYKPDAHLDADNGSGSGIDTSRSDPHRTHQPKSHVGTPMGALHEQKITSGGPGRAVELTSKEQAKQKRRTARQQRDVLKAERKSLKVTANSLRVRIKSGKQHNGKSISARDRLQMLQELRGLEKKIENLTTEIHSENKAQRGKKGRVKAKITGGLGKAWGATITKNAGEARGATLPDTVAINPFTWIVWGLDIAGLGVRTKDLCADLYTRKTLSTLADAGHKRLEEIEQLHGSDDYTTEIQQEEADIREALQPLEEEIEKIPVGEDVKWTAWSAVATTASTCNVIFGLATLMQILEIGTETFGVIAPVAGLVTAPISAGLTAVGMANTVLNLRDCRKDLKQSAQLADQAIPEAIWKALDPRTIWELPEMNDPSVAGLKNEMLYYRSVAQNTRGRIQQIDQRLQAGNLDAASAAKLQIERNQLIITVYQAEPESADIRIRQIDKQLLQGGLNKEQIRQLKHERHQIEKGMYQMFDHWIGRLESLDQTNPNVQVVLSHFKARKVTFNSAMRMQDKIIPHIQEKAKVKKVQEYINGVSDVLTLTATGLAVTGFVTSLAGGTGLPILVAAGVVMSASLTLRYGGGFLARQIVRMQQGKNRVKTAEFDHYFMDCMENEEKHAKDLKVAGLEEATVSKHMFDMTKKHYGRRPKKWSHTDWRHKIVSGSAKGKDRQALDRAFYSMRHRDHLKIINVGVFKFVDSLTECFTGGRRKSKRESITEDRGDSYRGRLDDEQRRRLQGDGLGEVA